MIPKKIHYCWFGGNPLPELAQKCIASWQKFCPDYEIIEWNESNFDINSCDYVREAYAAKKWAFVSDYARFQILYEHGGLYFDTDVELIKPLGDLVYQGGFMGCENGMVNPGLGLAVSRGHKLYEEILETYHALHFLNPDGSLNLNTVVTYTTNILKKHGFLYMNTIQCIDGIYIYPQKYFCPMDYDTGIITISPNTHAIHHYSASWHGKAEQYAHTLKKKLIPFMPRRIAGILATGISKLKFEGFVATVRWMLKH